VLQANCANFSVDSCNAKLRLRPLKAPAPTIDARSAPRDEDRIAA
jgi:hypothetical protein